MDTTNSDSLLILGRQPALGMAELEALYGPDAVEPAGPIAALVHRDSTQVNFNRLGGSIKLAHLLVRLDTVQWPVIEKALRHQLQSNLQHFPDGKIRLGISLHGFDITIAKLNATGLTLKKVAKAAGRSVRVVPNKELELNSAQVLHNQLASAIGWEFLVVRDGTTTLIARTTAIQDIDAYAARDQGRPKRDARVGMLPPKLAQTIVNLASGQETPDPSQLLLDPFCGTGVLLQEALLMGYSVYGTDLEPRMVEFTGKNLDWLHGQDASIRSQTASQTSTVDLEEGDATTYQWKTAPKLIAAETYLGQAFSTPPSAEKLAETRNTCNTILKKFLLNLRRQIEPGTRLCLAVPAWQQSDGSFVHLPTLDHLEDMGYNRVSFKHVSKKEHYKDFVYARTDQIVARELLVLIKD